MKFLDEIKIFVKSGSGGSGCCSFRREKFIEYGGPDGGNGGKGGDVIIKCSNSLNTLIDYKYKQHCIAKDGEPGMGKKKAGKNGNDFIVNIPIGTEILMDDKKTLIKDLSKENDQIIIAFGGNGGSGNINYKSSTNRAPRKFTKGEKGEEKWLYLKLKLIADIGIVGLPNAGKSSFIKKISNAKPKIGDYPFTTITPNLANVIINNIEITFADIPGIIEDAHKGKGLGLDFLSHIERCKILLHLIDVSDNNVPKNYEIIKNEIKKYKNKVEKKNELICLTKCDLLDRNKLKYKISELKKICKKEIYYCSNITGEGIKEVLKRLENLYGKKKIKKVVIKVGSSLIANYKTGLPKLNWINSFTNDLCFLIKKKINIIIVSSGAIAIGRKRIGFLKKKLNLDEQQAAASVGQIYLINNYKKAFNKKKIEISQVLLTLDDTIKKERKTNAKKTLKKLLEKKIIPIINENDTVATDEIKFGDNDRLSARVAEIIKADLLILLSDVSGLYDKDPKKNKKARLIKEVKSINKSIIKAASFTNNLFARGGMTTKIMAAKIATNAGCDMVIVNGNSKKIIQKIFEEEKGTYFHSKKRKKKD